MGHDATNGTGARKQGTSALLDLRPTNDLGMKPIGGGLDAGGSLSGGDKLPHHRARLGAAAEALVLRGCGSRDDPASGLRLRQSRFES